MMMKNILYLLHVGWEWTFQRPQIMALFLEKDYDCTVVYKKYIFARVFSHKNPFPKKKHIIWQFPKFEYFSVLRWLNAKIYKISIKKMIYNYDAIWICHPSLFKYVPLDYNGKIIYDCMDNHISMASSQGKEELICLQKKLIDRSDYIFASSRKLIDEIPGMKDAILVRNGFWYGAEKLPVKLKCLKEKYKIGYFGTISSWFDYSLIERSLNVVNNLDYYLIGPVVEACVPDSVLHNKKIIHMGVIEHSELLDVCTDYDALIMPFVVNDVILYVDPVKLYEYIYLGKCVISVWYPEIDWLEPYVYFYKDYDEYICLIKKLTKNGFTPKYNQVQQNNFLRNNSWKARYKIIRKAFLN